MSEGTEPEVREFARCGVKSAWKQGLLDAPGLFRRGRTLCMTCWAYDQTYRSVYLR